MLGICTSAIKQRVLFKNGDCKYNSADANVQVANPRDLTRFSTAVRDKSSSSTMDMSGFSVNRSLHC